MSTTAIFDITHNCLEFFDLAVAKHDSALLTHLIHSTEDADPRKSPPPCDFLGIRNSFLFWIDYTGALSLVDSSLDARLQGLADISAVVMELLEMVLRSLRRLDSVPEHTKPQVPSDTDPDREVASPYLSRWENACQAIRSGLDELHFVALAIRKASAKRLDQMVTTSVTPEDVVFRKNVTTLVRYRFPAARKALCQQLGDSIADRRQIIIQSKRHAKKLTVRREPQPSALPNAVPKAAGPGPALDPKIRARIVPRPSEVVSAVTKASRPDRKILEVRHIQPQRPKALSTVISTVSTSQEHSMDYPHLPKAKEGEVRVQCPFCLAPLDRSGSEKKRQDAWKRHVDEHTKPYPCLYPECAKSMTFFVRRREWMAHMEKSHSKDWMRKVHTMVWFCDIDHEEPVIFDTESSWRDHMRNLNSHPKRSLKAPTQVQLDALAPRKQQAALRDAYVCPLCEQIPQKLQPLAADSRSNQMELQRQIVDHVADHLKALSLMVLPSLQDTQAAPELSPESVELMGDNSIRELNDGSVAQPPSGIDLLDNISLPSEAWAERTLEQLEEHIIFDTLPSDWDPDFPVLPPIDRPPQVLEPWWYGPWLTEPEDDIDASGSNDPIISTFMAAWREWSGRTELHDAAAAGDVETLTQLLAQGANVNVKDSDRRTPLALAARGGHIDAMRVLISANADVNAEAQYHETPLLFAAENGHSDAVSLLVESSADVAVRGEQGWTALVKAAFQGHVEVAKFLLGTCEVNPDWGREPTPGDARDNTTALAAAARGGHSSMVKLLLDFGADLKVEDNSGKTALSSAAMHGNTVIVMDLLAHGANVDHRDDEGSSPLFLAINNSAEERDIMQIIRALLAYGADINGRNDNGDTALLRAAQCRRWGIVLELLELGADVGTTNKLGQSVLYLAAEDKQIATEILEQLASKGAEVEPSKSQTLAPLIAAAAYGSESTISFLLDHGAWINHQGPRQDYTPLMNAAQAGSLDNVALLLSRSADVNRWSLNGNTPLSVCLRNLAQRESDELYENSKQIAVRLVHAGAKVNKPRGFRDPVEVAAERELLKSDGEGNLERMPKPRLTNATCGRCGEMSGCEVDHTVAYCRMDWEPLCTAAGAGETDLVRMLLDQGANVNAWSRDQDGDMVTALMEAAASQSVDTVRVLLEAGADPNAQEPSDLHGAGYTALMKALAWSDDINSIPMDLLRAGADPNAVYRRQTTTLLLAISFQKSEAFQALIKYGADVNAAPDASRTPLMCSISPQNANFILPLLRAGADPREENEAGLTALKIAQDREMTEWVQVLEVWSRAAHIPDKIQNAQARFWMSIELGYEQVMEQALQDGADISAADDAQSTALHLAVSKTPRENVGSIVQKLVQQGAPLVAKNGRGLTPVALAARCVRAERHAYALRALLVAGVDLSEFLTMMQSAVIRDDLDSVTQLLEKGADPNETTTSAGFPPLWLAVSFKNEKIVDKLLQGKAVPRNERWPFASLHTATLDSSYGIIGSLLEAGANPSAAEPNGNTPLFVFVDRRDLRGIVLLLEYGARPSQKELIHAVRRADVQIVQLFLDSGANVNGVDDEGWTPLHHAVISRSQPERIKAGIEVTRILLSKGADVNARSFVDPENSGSRASEPERACGNTPLHISAWEGNMEAVELLLQAGADPNCPGAGQKTPLHYAAMADHVETAKLLIQAGCYLNTKDSAGTALFHAVFHDHPEMVRLLLGAGADIGSYGADLLYWAAKKDHVDIAMFVQLMGDLEHYEKEQARLVAGDGVAQIFDGDYDTDNLDMIKDRGLRARLALVAYLSIIELPPATCQRLIEAIRQNDHLALDSLLIRGANVHGESPEGRTPIAEAIIHGRADIIQKLVDVGGIPYEKAGHYLKRSIGKGNVEVTRALLNAGIVPPHPSDLDLFLDMALIQDNPDLIKALLREDADPNNCSSGLIIAAKGHHIDAMRRVLNAGVDPNVRYCGQFILDAASQGEDPEMVRFLLGEGATACSRRVLYWAAEHGFDDVILFLKRTNPVLVASAVQAEDRLEFEREGKYREGTNEKLVRMIHHDDFGGRTDKELIQHPGMRRRLGIDQDSSFTEYNPYLAGLGGWSDAHIQ